MQRRLGFPDVHHTEKLPRIHIQRLSGCQIVFHVPTNALSTFLCEFGSIEQNYIIFFGTRLNFPALETGQMDV